MTLIKTLLRGPEHGHVQPWNPVIAEQHAARTAHMLLGACGATRIVGNRRTDAILADRERRVQAMTTNLEGAR